MKHQNKTQVNQLGLDLWRDVVVRNKRIRERLRSTLLGLVHRERAGEVIDRALMRNITTVSALASVCNTRSPMPSSGGVPHLPQQNAAFAKILTSTTP